MNRRTKIMVYVNEQADSSEFYAKSQELGTLAAKSFQRQHNDARKIRHRAQMTGLENIAETTMKVTDVLDYIKKQTARQPGWTEDIGGKRFGESLKNYIEQDLKDIRDKVCNSVGIGNSNAEDKRDRQQVYLHLIRQLVRQLVVQYEYETDEAERTRKEKGRDRR